MKNFLVRDTRRDFGTTNTILVVAIAIVLTLTFGRIISLVLQDDGSHDFHPYWYQGHSLRRESNPYRAYLFREVPNLPISYIDGVTITTLPVAQADLSQSVTNTAPLVLLLSMLAFYSWPVAKINWMAINLALILFLPWLLIRSFSLGGAFGRTDRLLIILGTFAFAATRGSVAIGQTTLIVFCLLLGVLILRRRYWFLAGILLGIGLSKYSLAIPFILFLLLEGKRRYWAIIGVALLTQLLGLLALTVISGDSPLTILGYYRTIAQSFSTDPNLGVQLGIIFPAGSQLILIASGLITLFVAAGVGSWWMNERRKTRDGSILAGHVVLIILLLWLFLLAYNGGYDMLVMLLILPVAIFLWRHPGIAGLSAKQSRFAVSFFILFQLLLSLPFTIANNLTLELTYLTFDKWVARMYIILLLMMLTFLLWLLARLKTRSITVPGLEYKEYGED
jgi:hypothetical protein